MQQEDRIAVLRSVFACPNDAALALDQATRWHSFTAREIVAHQGDRARSCHLVLGGAIDVKVLGAEGQYSQIASVEPGELFGQYPQADDERADLVARGSLEMLSIETAALDRIAIDVPQLGRALAGLFSRQLGHVLDRLAARVTLTANGRVYAKLLELFDEDGRLSPIPVVAAVAVEAGTARETASRAISNLERRGIIRRDQDEWLLLARRMLEDMVV